MDEERLARRSAGQPPAPTPLWTMCANCDAVAGGHLEHGHCNMPPLHLVGPDPYADDVAQVQCQGGPACTHATVGRCDACGTVDRVAIDGRSAILLCLDRATCARRRGADPAGLPGSSS